MTWIFDRLFGPRPDIDEALLAAHVDRAGELAEHLAADAGPLDADERRRHRQRVPVTDDATMASLAVVLADRLRRVDRPDDAGPRLTVLIARPLPLTPPDLVLLVELAAGSDRFARRRILALVAAAGERMPPAQAHQTAPAITRAVDLLESDRSATAGRLRSRLLGVLPPALATLDGLGLVASGDEWTRVVHPALARLVDRDPSLIALVEFISSTVGAKPTPTWLTRARALLTATEGRGGEVCRLLLGGVIETPTSTWRTEVSHSSVRLLRGAVWLAVVSKEPWVAGTLTSVYRQASHLDDPAGTLADDCLAGLARLATDAAVAQLAELWWAEPAARPRASIQKALDAAAHRRGTTRSALLEPHVPRVSWARIVRAERRRVEMTLAEDRRWDLGTWTARYVVHPVTGRLAAGLVWSIERSPARWTGMVAPDSPSGVVGFVGADGSPIDVGDDRAADDVVIGPWHPLYADESEIRAWREFLETRRLEQQIPQVLRPVFHRTSDESDSASATLRFAERSIDMGRARRFLRSRGWSAGRVFRREWLPGAEWAELLVAGPGDRRLLTGALRFSAPFSQLPPIVFSEAVYDVTAMLERAEPAAVGPRGP